MDKKLLKSPAFLAVLIGILAFGIMLFVVFRILNLSSTQKWQEIKFGLDTCSYCGMIISDARYAVAARSIQEDGSHKIYYFDDIGCFLNSLVEHQHLKWDGWVFDYDTGQQIEIHKASFEKSNDQTPMGSGWIAHTHKNKNGLTFKELISNLPKK